MRIQPAFSLASATLRKKAAPGPFRARAPLGRENLPFFAYHRLWKRTAERMHVGACYSCNGCGKCRTWMKGLEGACPFCRKPVATGDARCPSCGRALPLPPGATGAPTVWQARPRQVE